MAQSADGANQSRSRVQSQDRSHQKNPFGVGERRSLLLDRRIRPIRGEKERWAEACSAGGELHGTAVAKIKGVSDYHCRAGAIPKPGNPFLFKKEEYPRNDQDDGPVTDTVSRVQNDLSVLGCRFLAHFKGAVFTDRGQERSRSSPRLPSCKDCSTARRGTISQRDRIGFQRYGTSDHPQ